ncbi:MAG: restriction endonuclease subunit S [Deltaproteobacteria bacterium]|nr:restriction endonuclease subunit S [Deltaproteobacteria bacterium]
MKRNKLFLHEVNDPSVDGVEELLTVSQYTGVTRRRERLSDEGQLLTNAASLAGYKRVQPGDLVMNIMLAWNGSLGVSAIEGIASPAYCVFRVKSGVEPQFLHYLLRTPLFTGAFKTVSTGVVDSRLRLYPDVFFRLPSLLPSVPEQSAIVRFLDHADRRIRRYIRAKQKLIKLLEEQKQAIIHRAVTRGLDPNVRLKPSGVEWLGEVPEHWEVMRVSRFARVGNGSTPSRGKPAYWHGGAYPWLNSSNVNRGFIDSADQFVTQTALQECHLPRVAAGSVLVAITGQGKTRGASAVLGVEATINQHIAYITPRNAAVSSGFLHLALVAAYQTLRALSEDSGSTKGALTCEDLKRFKIPIPPALEQTALVERILTETGALVTAIAHAQGQIDLLREYRTRLIADVVTGKLDVREAAERLPDEEESEGLEEGEGLVEGDESIGDGDVDAAPEEAEA